MKKVLSALLIVLLMLLIIPNKKIYAQELNEEQIEFINSIKDEAIKGYNEYNIYASLTIAQAILESSWGKSKLSKDANNLFGVKAYNDWNGDIYTISTKEYSNTYNDYIYIDANFKYYNSITDSVKDHNELLNTERYAKVRSSNNYVEACNAILECGYATSPSYSKKLIEIIECFNLTQYDVILTNNEIDLANQPTESKQAYYDPIIKTATNRDYQSISILNSSSGGPNIGSKEDTNNIPQNQLLDAKNTHGMLYIVFFKLLAN